MKENSFKHVTLTLLLPFTLLEKEDMQSPAEQSLAKPIKVATDLSPQRNMSKK